MSYRLEDLWPTWQEDARCHDQGVNYYFGDENEQPTMSIAQVRRASKLCDACPVYEDCLRHALTMREEYGVWAGTSGRTRRKLFKRLDEGAPVATVIEEYLHGRRGRQAEAASSLPGGGSWADGEDQGRAGVRHEAGGGLAL